MHIFLIYLDSGFAVDPSVNNCILCCINWKYESWGWAWAFTEGLSIIPLPHLPPPGQSPGRRRMSKDLEDKKSSGHPPHMKAPRQTNLFLTAGCSGSYVDLWFELYLMRKECLGIKGDFSLPATLILEPFWVKAETWGSKIPVVLSQFIRAYWPSLTTFMSLYSLIAFSPHLVDKYPHKHQTTNTLSQQGPTDS